MAGNRRARAFNAPCPKCGVGPSVPCRRSDGTPRVSVHVERLRDMKLTTAAKTHEPVGFYASEAWRRVRYQALKLNGGTCQCCGALPARGKSLHVDHVEPRSKRPDLELALSNLQVLCEACNLGKGASDNTDWRRK